MNSDQSTYAEQFFVRHPEARPQRDSMKLSSRKNSRAAKSWTWQETDSTSFFYCLDHDAAAHIREALEEWLVSEGCCYFKWLEGFVWCRNSGSEWICDEPDRLAAAIEACKKIEEQEVGK